MNQTIETLTQIRDALKASESFPDFGCTLDEADESLSITIVGSKTRFLVKNESNVGSFVEDLVSTNDTSRIFESSNINYVDGSDNAYNRIFIQCQEQYMNHRLQAWGHVFLNEVYDALGFERTRSGAILGWLKDSDGMGYIDFGMGSEQNAGWAEGLKKEAFLTFNVDGVIFDKI